MSSTIDQQFIEYIVKSLVSKPDEVKIERRIDEKGVLLELTVDSEDLGRVIGKRGATAQSLRTLLRALGTKQDARYNLKIIDPNGGYGGRHSDDDNNSFRSDSNLPQDNQAPDENGNVSNDTASPDIPVDNSNDTTSPALAEDAPRAEAEELSEEESHSDRISQARKELADLDDLDV